MRAATITPKKLLKEAEQSPVINWGLRVNEIEMRYRTRPYDKVREYPKVTGSKHCAEILKEHYSELLANTVEYFSVLFLNRANGVIGFQVISMGGYTGTVADPRLILKAALLCEATQLILCHNHPSGNLKPSMADRELTIKIREAAKYMDIQVLDHVILSDSGYFSFADEGIL